MYVAEDLRMSCQNRWRRAKTRSQTFAILGMISTSDFGRSEQLRA